MKQWLKNAKYLLLVPIALLMANCSNKSSSSNNNNSSAYYYSNGACYVRATGMQTDPSYCNGQTTSQYYLQNGVCIDSRTGGQVPYNYCQGTIGGASQRCEGYYYYPMNNTQGYCQTYSNGFNNCSGYTLVNQYGQQVYCQ